MNTIGRSHPYLLATLPIMLVLCSSCGGGGGGGGDTQVVSNSQIITTNTDTSDELYAPDRLLRIDITMDSADYDTLRLEGRSFPQVFAGCWKNFGGYSHFKATVSVDGEVFHDVDIRKKGFLGSLSPTRPSLKLNFSTYAPDRRLESMKRVTLNNDRQDPSHTHQCITYQMFRDAGLAAPRCSFARVSLNGRDLGVYTNVESIKKPFLLRNFNDDEGNLYEAQVADFGTYTKENFQLKTNEHQNDRSDLDAVVEALDADDSVMPDLLSQVLDVDEFISYWAMEVISGHWDGATGNANNYYVYHDPVTNLFRYIPWGTDGSMALEHGLAPGTGPLYRYTRIPSRLYKIPSYRQRFHQRVLRLMDALWDSDALDAEVSRIRTLTGTPESEMTGVRSFIAQHEKQVRDAVAGDLVQVERTIVDRATACNDTHITSISGSFTGDTGSFTDAGGKVVAYREGSYEFVDIDGNLIQGSAIAEAPEQDPDRSDEIKLILWMGFDWVEYVVVVQLEEFGLGAVEVPIHGVANTLTLYKREESGDWELVGRGGTGNISFAQPPVLGEPPNLSFSSNLWLRLPGVRF